MQKLADILAEIDTGTFDVEATGFNADEIYEIINGAKDIVDDDHKPEPLETPISLRGMVWNLGKHRLMCGDSTSMEDMAVLMAGEKADCIWTDPPYGVSYTEKNDYLNKERAGIEHRAIEGDDLRGQDLEDFLVKAFQVMSTNIKDGGCI